AARAVRSVTRAGARVLLVGQNPDEATRRALAEIDAAEPAVEVRVTDRNLGCGGGRQFAIELVDTELVLFLDDDAELIPGALEHLVADLDGHPEASAVTPVVVFDDAIVHHYGGWVEVSDELVTFELGGAGQRYDDAELAPTGPSGWVPGTAALYRTAVFADVPIDSGMAAYYEDNDWCLRLEQRRPASLRRCREAIAMHGRPRPPAGSPFVRRARAVGRLAAHAHFYRTHGVLLESGLIEDVPEICRAGSGPDLAAARLLLDLLSRRGTDWTLAEWMNGGLAPLLGGAHDEALRGQTRRLGAEAELLRGETQRLGAESELLRDERRRLGEEIDRLRGESEVRRAYAVDLEAHLRKLESGARGLEHELAAAQAQLAAERDERRWLTSRHETLARVEQGGWWRLRGRLQPALRVAARGRRTLRRRAGR
ncbi:MAG: hypothetical protein QOJ35_3141, partial [Solirubrobacteraceae bacterium]|nr:hypothetical protein [Solirubrobacteraceae bacterium]